ncbi:ribosome silencing factor [Iamia sp. SCSIO 61187]|uniref:ribosome silencing factor n=1 Tax=Iamia sp. SCSIO 61187 TaxID=2722752 RepID=UPI001C639D31|nr:ribosome silencing factor [Iamia sp. SCSIO 61187]QYG93468.1 ribosome silencing factor [Iamia sp. SCSIO 61187]
MAEPSDTDGPALAAARAADAKGGTSTVVLRVGEVLGITELFVITSATNPRLVRAVVDEIEERVAQEHGVRPIRIEGRDDLRWVLMDYGDWVAHVFLDEARSFYDLERLWADVPRVAWAPAPA